MNEWISIKDRLPHNLQKVLVYTEFKRMFDAWFSNGVWYENHEGRNLDFDGVTHWMPLPEPPKYSEYGAIGWLGIKQYNPNKHE